MNGAGTFDRREYSSRRQITMYHCPAGRCRPAVARIAVALSICASAAQAQAPDHPVTEADLAGVRGTYVLPGGDTALLGGWPARGAWRQRIFLQVGDERRPLRAIAADHFVTKELDTLRVVRQDREATGLEWSMAGRNGSALAPRVEPYVEREVTFESHGIRLAGTLLLPQGPGPHSAVVLVHGAGADWREPYRSLADHFARNGIAALIYDKRGVGASDGDWRLASFEDLADDAISAVAMLRSRPEIEPLRVGLWGISQGGWIVALAATRSPDVAFIIPVSGAGVTPAEQEMWRLGNNLRFRELSPAAIGIGIKANHMFYSVKPLAERGWITLPADIWFRSLDLHLDPARIWERVRQPVLGIWGGTDGLVPTAESVATIRAALERAGNYRYTLRVFPGADHDLLQAREGFQHERLDRIVSAEGYRDAMALWIRGLPASAAGRRMMLPAASPPTRLAWHGIARDATPVFGGIAVQLPLLLGMLLVFLGLVTGTVLAPFLRRRRVGPAGLPRRGRIAAAVAGTLGLVTIGGWISTALPALLLETGNPVVAGHPIGLAAARLASTAAVVALVVLAVEAWRARKADRLGRVARVGYATVVLAAAVFVLWAWYWHLLPWT